MKNRPACGRVHSVVVVAITVALGGCATPPVNPSGPINPQAIEPQGSAFSRLRPQPDLATFNRKPPTPSAPEPEPAPSIPLQNAKVALAQDLASYKKEVAMHLYALNASNIYQGKLPPFVYAIGVVQLEVNSQGHVHQVQWLRQPKHAPEVISAIEKLIQSATPFPKPVHLKVPAVVTEVWLWDKSGRFQLDTLSPGQSQ